MPIRHLRPALALALLVPFGCQAPATELETDPWAPGALEAPITGIDCGAPVPGVVEQCSLPGTTYASTLRIGASTTSKVELAQTFVATASGPAQTLWLQLRSLRALPSGVSAFVDVELREASASTPPTLGTLVATGQIPVSSLSSALAQIDLTPEGSAAIQAGTRYAVVLLPTVPATGTSLVGVGTGVTDLVPTGASWRRPLRWSGSLGWGEARWRPSELGDFTFRLRLGACAAGYTLSGAACVDVNECTNGGCDPLVTCTNTPGSFSCGACPPGYLGTGVTCTLNDPCALSDCNPGHSTCVPDGATYTCDCASGWAGVRCDTCAADHYGPSCDACPTGTNGTCDGHGACDASVTNFDGCQCDDGFQGSTCSECASGYFGASCSECPGGATNACNGRGFCDQGMSGLGQCYCDGFSTGVACETCAGHREGPQCQSCQNGWVGFECDWACPGGPGNVCNGRGTCSESQQTWGVGECACNAPYTGAACDECEPGHYGASCAACTTTPASCHGNGDCDDGLSGNGACRCRPGFAGPDCATCAAGFTGPDCVPDGAFVSLAVGVTYNYPDNYGFTCAVRTDHSLWCWGGNNYGQLGLGDTARRNVPTRVGTGTDWASVAVGSSHACAVKTDGHLFCWGRNTNGQLGDGTTTDRLAPVAIGTAIWAELSASNVATCGRRTDGSAWCWGAGGSGLLGTGLLNATSSVPAQVAGGHTFAKGPYLGSEHACALDGVGAIWCWGSVESMGMGERLAGPLAPGLGVAQAVCTASIAALAPEDAWQGSELCRQAGCAYDDGAETCSACDGASQSTCWSDGCTWDNAAGACRSRVAVRPRQVGSDTGWQRLAVSSGGTCVTNAAGQIWCWGSPDSNTMPFSQQDPNRYDLRNGLPLLASEAGSSYADVTLGSGGGCGREFDGTLQCWGSYLPYHYAGFETAVEQVDRALTWRLPVLGAAHGCVQTNSGPQCWGSNLGGEVGFGAFGHRYAPEYFHPYVGWKEFEPGVWGEAALRLDGTVWGGSYMSGPDGSNTAPLTRVGTFSDVVHVDVGHTQANALRSNGQIMTWQGTGGSNVHAVAFSDWTFLTFGDGHGCGLRGGQPWCWGYNTNLAFGDGAAVGASVSDQSPVRLGTGSDWTFLAAGHYATFGLRSGGTLWAVGSQSNGLLGNGLTSGNLGTPGQVGALGGWTDVDVWENHACGVRAGGLYCWGDGSSGKLGLGSTTSFATPQRIGVASDWTRVTAGDNHTCALKGAGELWCWGRNAYGEVGDGTTTQRTSPVRIGSLSDWTFLRARRGTACGVRTGGELSCWGDPAVAANGGIAGDGTYVVTQPTAVVLP